MSDKNKHDQNNISRRRFLQIAGLSAGAVAIGACSSTNDSSHNDAEETMTYRINPSTGDKVSILGYGCMRLPTIGLVSGDASDETIDQEAVNESVDYALEHGVNYFDTSPAYCKGKSEEAMGIALARHPRESYFIATKLSNFDPSTWSRQESEKMFNNSLKYLQTSYIDYMLLHGIGMGGMDSWNARYIDNGMFDFLKAKRADGTIRNLGFSYHGDVAVFNHLLDLHDSGDVHWDFAQIQLNYVDWEHAQEINPRNTNASYLLAELEKRNIPAVIMEPLLGGRLAKQPPVIFRRMKELRPDNSVASWAFRFAGTPQNILTVLSGMTYIEHLKENIQTYSPLEPITPEEDAFLARVASDMIEADTVPCTRCRYCMPCPYGVDIPEIFSHYNLCVLDGLTPSDSNDPEYAKARRAFLYGYDKRVPKLRQANHCVACGACVSHCPQNIPIPSRLKEISDYTETLRQNKR